LAERVLQQGSRLALQSVSRRVHNDLHRFLGEHVKAGIELSKDGIGDSYYNALA